MAKGILTAKIRDALPKNRDLKDSAYYVFFEASTQRLAETEIKKLNKGETAEFIRGSVEIRKEIPNTRLYEVLFRETNISFGRFEKEVINEREILGGVWLGY